MSDMPHFAKGADRPPGDWRPYRKFAVVNMLRMEQPFTCESREGTLQGQPGDFLVEDGHGGFYVISPEAHALTYAPAEVSDPEYDPGEVKMVSQPNEAAYDQSEDRPGR